MRPMKLGYAAGFFGDGPVEQTCGAGILPALSHSQGAKAGRMPAPQSFAIEPFSRIG